MLVAIKNFFIKNRFYFTLGVLFLAVYTLFYYRVLFGSEFITGKDTVNYFYPMRYYLWDSLSNLRFPFWTEKMLGGFPIYADGESGYLNPLNVLSIVLFGPFISYKILHFSFFILGALGFSAFLKNLNFTWFGTAASVIAYYFSFFMFYHQQHFGITMSFFLFPFAFYFFTKILKTPLFSDFVLLGASLITIVYFGSYQSVFFIFLIFLYYFCVYFFSYPEVKYRLFKLFIFAYYLLVFLIPLFYPSFQLYKNSTRLNLENIYLEGSYNPLMISNLGFPFLFDTGRDYKWGIIRDSYFEHETYIYLGITVLVFSFVAYLYLNDEKMKLFLSLCILTFLILGHLKFTPLINEFDFPPINIFRFWGRSSIILSFALSILLGYFVSFGHTFNLGIKSLLNKLFKNKWHFILLFVWLSQVVFSFVASKTSFMILEQISKGAVPIDKNFKVWAILLAFSVLYLIVKFFWNPVRFKKYFEAFVLVIIVFDLYFFGYQVIEPYFRDFSNIYDTEFVSKLETYPNERVLSTSKRQLGNQGLYLKSWGLLGYSQFYTEDYANLLSNFGINKAKEFNVDEDSISTYPQLNIIDSIGVSKVLNGDGDVILDFPGTNILNLNSLQGTYEITKYEEGEFNFNIELANDSKLNTFIVNNPNWVVKINGEEVISKEGLFLSLDILKGTNLVYIKYFPKDFYFSLILMFGLLLVSICIASGFNIYKRHTHTGNSV